MAVLLPTNILSVSQILVHCRPLKKEAGEQDETKKGRATPRTCSLQGECLPGLLLPSELVWDTDVPPERELTLSTS